MTDERFERFLQEWSREYHRPPPTPKGEMWEVIRGRVGGSVDRWSKARRPPTWIWWGAGLAAALVLGIAIGRFTPPSSLPEDSVRVVEAGARGGTNPAFRVAATEHLAQVQTFITLFQLEARAGRADDASVRPAQDLLFTTQLLLDSPAAEDVQFRTLLEDIELVLAQIALYSRGRPVEELEFIDRGMEQRGVLLKLQAAVMSGPAGAQGVL